MHCFINVLIKKDDFLLLFDFNHGNDLFSKCYENSISNVLNYLLAAVASGLRRTKITESPRKNIFEMKRSLLTGFTFFLPFPVRGTSVHISLTLQFVQ